MKYVAGLLIILAAGCFLAVRLWKRSRLIIVYELRKVGGI
jgi:hypothetical protein